MSEAIIKRLIEIEQAQDVRILYACESGSRAWGFPSVDSDYDVRFIYLQRLDWYLSLEERRDVIEYPLEQDLDINGWDLKKALRLFRASNPPLLEWLGSPVIYLEKTSTAAQMRALAKSHYSPMACIYHYLHMAQGNYRQYLMGEQVKTKKYFYVLRPILAIQWIEAGYGVAPTGFGSLLERLVPSGPLKDEIQRMIDLKRQGVELDEGLRIPVVSEFIESELERLEAGQADYQSNAAPYAALDDIFRDALREAWLS